MKHMEYDHLCICNHGKRDHKNAETGQTGSGPCLSCNCEEYQKSSGSNEHLDQGKARDIVAKQVGLSPTTYQRAKTIIEKAPEELKEKSGQANQA